MTLLDDAHAADFIKHLEIFEGRTSYFYLDSGSPSSVTIGVGVMIPSASVAESLNWEGGMGAIAIAAAEWQTVKDATPGLAAASYAHLTTNRLSSEEVDKLRDKRIASMESDLIHAIQGVSAMPQPIVQCLCDMAFNIGSGKLHAQYFGPTSKFGPAIYRADWQTAAAESARRGIQPARNEYVRDLIMSTQNAV